MKLNVFTPSSQNNLQFTTPLMTSATGVGSGQAAQPSANLRYFLDCKTGYFMPTI